VAVVGQTFQRRRVAPRVRRAGRGGTRARPFRRRQI